MLIRSVSMTATTRSKHFLFSSAITLIASMALFPVTALAQDATPLGDNEQASTDAAILTNQQAADPAPEIIVTGTRVARSGYEAPTPLTVATTAQIEEAARPNIADFVNTLPSVASSSTPQNSQGSIGAG